MISAGNFYVVQPDVKLSTVSSLCSPYAWMMGTHYDPGYWDGKHAPHLWLLGDTTTPDHWVMGMHHQPLAIGVFL